MRFIHVQHVTYGLGLTAFDTKRFATPKRHKVRYPYIQIDVFFSFLGLWIFEYPYNRGD